METLLWGAVLRFAQALAQATPTILVGLLVAGVFRHLLGYENTRKLTGSNTWRSLPQAWLLGMLLPVCSLGVIPILREMRRSGVAVGALLAFGLTAPLFNPISVLYGLTLASPVVIITFSFCSLVIVTIMGLAWDRLFPATTSAEAEPARPAPGYKRMLAIGVFAARELTSPTLAYILIGLLGVALLSIILPYGYLQQSAEASDARAPLFMTAIAIPAYATPMTAMVQLASMFQHGNSVGAAFALLVLGAGVNLGLFAWLIRSYGVKKMLTWFGLLVGIVLVLAYGVDKPLYPQGVESAGHTHAFDIYCAPFHSGSTAPFQSMLRTLQEKTAPHEQVALIALGVLLLCGTGLAIFDPARRVEAWLAQLPSSERQLDVVLSPKFLAAVALLGLIGSSIAGCYVYYPTSHEIFEELRLINVEVASSAVSGDWDTALYWIPIYEDWTRKLEVSVFLRGQPVSPYQRAKLDVLREKLELLEHEVEDREISESRDVAIVVSDSYRRARTAFMGNPIAQAE